MERFGFYCLKYVYCLTCEGRYWHVPLNRFLRYVLGDIRSVLLIQQKCGYELISEIIHCRNLDAFELFLIINHL